MATVQQAAALLDSKYGPSWPERIDLDKLDQGTATLCVAGQLEPDNRGSYGVNVAYQDRTAELATILDENVSPHLGPFGGGEGLTEQWKALIRERLGNNVLIRDGRLLGDESEGDVTLVTFNSGTTYQLDGDVLTIEDEQGDSVQLNLAALRGA